MLEHDVSLIRLYVLRAMFLGNLVMLGYGVWPAMMGLHQRWEPVPAVAFSFWAALGALSVLGLRYPLAMLPVLLLQLLYKALWVLAVWLPLQIDGLATDMSVGGIDLSVMIIGGAVSDVVVIPWRYVVARYVKARGDRWRGNSGTHVQLDQEPSNRPSAASSRTSTPS